MSAACVTPAGWLCEASVWLRVCASHHHPAMARPGTGERWCTRATPCCWGRRRRRRRRRRWACCHRVPRRRRGPAFALAAAAAAVAAAPSHHRAAGASRASSHGRKRTTAAVCPSASELGRPWAINICPPPRALRHSAPPLADMPVHWLTVAAPAASARVHACFVRTRACAASSSHADRGIAPAPHIVIDYHQWHRRRRLSPRQSATRSGRAGAR
jgi:hypothetical protein